MKHLIIILILFSLCKAQDTLIVIQANDDIEFEAVPYYPFTLDQKICWNENELNQQIDSRILDLLNGYQKECYADSTWITYSAHSLLEKMGRLNDYVVKRVDNDIVWLEKKPTLEGFIEYLRRK
jgi:hypothetical protein